MLDALYLLRPADDLFLPVVVLGVQLVGLKAVLTGDGADGRLVVDVQGDAVLGRQLLRQYGLIFLLHLF